MSHRLRNAVLISIVAAIALWWMWDTMETGPSTQALRIHLGEWTNPQGPPGNRIRFWLQEAPTSTAAIGVLDGHLQVENFLGRAKADGRWNYGYYEPLHLNLVFSDGPEFVIVRRAGPDTLEMRASKNSGALLGPDPFAHSDTIQLERVTDAPP